MTTELMELRAEVERLTRQRDEALRKLEDRIRSHTQRDEAYERAAKVAAGFCGCGVGPDAPCKAEEIAGRIRALKKRPAQLSASEGNEHGEL